MSDSPINGSKSEPLSSHYDRPTGRTLLEADTSFGYLDRSSSSEKIYNPVLFYNEDDATMLSALIRELRRSVEFTCSVAFITEGAVAMLKQVLLDFSGTLTLTTSTYLDFNDPEVFRELLELRRQRWQNGKRLTHLRVLSEPYEAFHAKGYVFRDAHDTVTAIIGSSNLTRKALTSNSEWNLRFSALPDGDIACQLYERLADQRDRTLELTEEWIAQYEQRRQPRLLAPDIEQYGDDPILDRGDPAANSEKIIANSMQEVAIKNLMASVESGARRALIISATGTGKTILAALIARQLAPNRMLFVVHREQILKKARLEFQKVLNEYSPGDFGLLSGSRHDYDAPYLFATVQSLSRQMGEEKRWSKDAFDLIIIDEAHRSGADSYRTLMDYFDPNLWLGLTATPERSDDNDVFEQFHFNVPYEIRLERALEEKMLCPFNYYGVLDVIDPDGNVIDEKAAFDRLVAEERIDHIIETVETYGFPRDVKGLIFCSSKREAATLSEKLNTRYVFGRRLRTAVLTGDDSIKQREKTVDQLVAGELDYILTIDIFNEGIDIPEVNQILLLRQTQSSIIFTQQLGRGLRKHEGKDHLRVIDFIGNYKNNYLIPIALTGIRSGDKDKIRERLEEAQEKGYIEGGSTIQFDPNAAEQVLLSLRAASLNYMRELRADYQELRGRLGKAVSRYQIEAHGLGAERFVNGTKVKNFWTFLYKAKEVRVLPQDQERVYLNFLDQELLSGKRPHELLVLKKLIETPGHRMSNEEVFSYLADEERIHVDRLTMESIHSVLSLEFFESREVTKYEHLGLVELKPCESEDQGRDTLLAEQFKDSFLAGCDWVLRDEFLTLYEQSTEGSTAIDLHGGNFEPTSFSSHVADIIATGLYISRHSYGYASSFVLGKKYSSKDVCRLLNWKKNLQSVMFGYKTDEVTATCPILITYHKKDDIDAATRYEDEWLGGNHLRWFTKNNRTLGSKTEKDIINQRYTLPIFIKRDDPDGTDRYDFNR